MSNSSIWLIDRTQSGASTPNQSRWRSNGNEEVLRIPQSSSITEASLSLFSLISRTLVGGVLPLCKDAVSVFYNPSQLGHRMGGGLTPLQFMYSMTPANWAIRHLLGESYPSAVMQSVYSTAPANWATGHLLEESYPSVEMQSVYSMNPATWASITV